jgi:hypothetical protein
VNQFTPGGLSLAQAFGEALDPDKFKRLAATKST